MIDEARANAASKSRSSPARTFNIANSRIIGYLDASRWKRAPRRGTKSLHRRSGGLPPRNTRGIEIVEAEHVDPDEIRCHTLAMERVDATSFAEEMTRGHRVELIFGQRIRSG